MMARTLFAKAAALLSYLTFAMATAPIHDANAQERSSYCPSSGGACYNNLAAAEHALSVHMPEYSGLFKLHSRNVVDSTSVRFEYKIEYQKPAKIHPATFIIGGWLNSTSKCPGQVATLDPYHPQACLSDSLLISEWTKDLQDDEQCKYTNIRTTGSFGSDAAGNYSNWPGPTGYVYHAPQYKNLEWDINCAGWGTTKPDHRFVQVAKYQAYECPNGFRGRDGPAPLNQICEINKGLPYIILRNPSACDLQPEDPSGGCGKSVIELEGAQMNDFDPRHLFHKQQTCIAKRSCRLRCEMDNCRWMDEVIPSFVDPYLHKQGLWPIIEAGCASTRALMGAITAGQWIADHECFASMGWYHVKVDLRESLVKHGCGSERDWKLVGNEIEPCLRQSSPGHPETYYILGNIFVHRYREQVRRLCLLERDEEDLPPFIDDSLKGPTCAAQ